MAVSGDLILGHNCDFGHYGVCHYYKDLQHARSALFVDFCARTSQIMTSVQNFAWSGFSKTAKVKSGRISRFILFLAWFVRLTMVGGHRICKLSWAGSPWIKRIYAKRSKSDLSTWDVIRTKSNFQKKYSAYFRVFTIRPSLLGVYKERLELTRDDSLSIRVYNL